MSDMLIYVPSLGRSSDIGWGVPRFLSPAVRSRLIYVVPEDQETTYLEALVRADKSYPGLGDATVVGCPEKGIAKTRLWIGADADGRSAGKFLMLDDDIWFYKRKSDNPAEAALDYTKGEETTELMSVVEVALNDYAHVGISAREGNNRIDEQHPVDGGMVTALACTRTLRALAYRTDEFLRCEHGRVEVMEDFDVNLQILRRGQPNLNIAHWAQGQRQTNAPGGCSTYRTHEVQDRSARKLAELHPNFVALREKKNKSGGEFGHRTEVTIYWKKAYEQGRRVSA